MANDKPRYLTAAQVVLRWDCAVTAGTLANWRAQGRGPAYQKFGSRVRYGVNELERWEADHLINIAANDNNRNDTEDI